MKRPSRTRTALAGVLLTALAATAGWAYAHWYLHDLPEHWQPLQDSGGCELFPQEAVFRQRIDDVQAFPTHPDSQRWILSIGGATRLHPDWGESEDQSRVSRYYGIPINVVTRSELPQPWPRVTFDNRDERDHTASVPSESDCAVGADTTQPRIASDCSQVDPLLRRFPFPEPGTLKAEGGACNDPARCGDRHVLVVETGSCRLWEAYRAFHVDGRWQAYATTTWDLNRMDQRPDGWTSADAAGLPITPLLLRANEASAGQILHALRVTFRDSVLSDRHVWPARHHAGDSRSDGIPFGAVLRLRPDVDIPWWWTPQAKAVGQAMQRYGLYVADIGSDLFIQGEPDQNWSAVTRRQLRQFRLSDFEFVDTQTWTRHPRFDANSLQAHWPHPPASGERPATNAPN